MPGPGKGRNQKAFEKPKNVRATVAFLWKYISRHKGVLLLAIVLTILNVLASLYTTSLMQPIIDNYLHPADSSVTLNERTLGLLHGVIEIAAFYLIEVIFAYLQSRILVHFSQNTINSIRNDLFDYMQSLPVRFYDTNSRGELMSRFTNDCDALTDTLQSSITSFLSSAVTLVGVIFMMLKRSVVLTLINLLIIPLLLLTVGHIMKKSRHYFAKRQQYLGEVNGYIEEMIAGQKVIKVFSHEEEAVEGFDMLNDRLNDAAVKSYTFGGLMMPLSRNLNNCVYSIIAMVGGVIAITSGAISMGTLVVFLQLSSRFGRPLNEISNQFISVVTALAGAERICNVMEEKPEDNSGAYGLENDGGDYYWTDGKEKVPVRGDVRFKDVTFGYEPGQEILHNISLYAKPGQKIAFVGSTGAGKTTIINLITRFYDINSGLITIDGIDSADIRRRDVRDAMAVVLQDTHLFTGTVRDNIRYGRPGATDEDVERAARLACAHSFIRRLPQGYDTVIEGDGANLSQGQRQLLNIARAAIADSPVLILDEATSSVDTMTEREIEKGLDRLMKNRTTFVIAHRLSTVRNSNAIMVMEHGEIIERGTHDDLLALKGRYYELYTGRAELA